MPTDRTALAHAHCGRVRARCRDEFSLDFRTEQYREQLKLESKHAARALQLLRSQAPATAAAAAAGPPVAAAGKLVEGRDKPFLYDLVYDAADASHSGASKLHRCAAAGSARRGAWAPPTAPQSRGRTAW